MQSLLPSVKGLSFTFLVESVNLLPSISASILSCCVSFIHMMIYSIMFLMFLVLHIALILVITTLKAIIKNQLFVNSRYLIDDMRCVSNPSLDGCVLVSIFAPNARGSMMISI